MSHNVMMMCVLVSNMLFFVKKVKQESLMFRFKARWQYIGWQFGGAKIGPTEN